MAASGILDLHLLRDKQKNKKYTFQILEEIKLICIVESVIGDCQWSYHRAFYSYITYTQNNIYCIYIGQHSTQKEAAKNFPSMHACLSYPTLNTLKQNQHGDCVYPPMTRWCSTYHKHFLDTLKHSKYTTKQTNKQNLPGNRKIRYSNKLYFRQSVLY